jgi:uncharacterized protein YukE
MSQGVGYDVESAALRRFATALEDAADRVALIRRRTSGLHLSSGAFGKLAESDSLKADYDTQTAQADEDLNDVTATLQSIAEDLRQNADAYDANEEEQVRTFGGGTA